MITKVPGYDNITLESQEHLRQAFEHGMPIDKEFKGISEELAKKAPIYPTKEYDDADA